MYIAHKDVHPQKHSRVSDTSWTIADVDFKGGPFLSENTTAASLMGFARTAGDARVGYYFPAGATGTLTATGGHTPFLGTANDVGTLWLVKHTRPDNKDDWNATADKWTMSDHATISAEIRVKGDFTIDAGGFQDTMSVKVERKVGNGEWQEYRTFTSAVAYSATEDEDDVYYRVTVINPDAAKTEISFTAKNQVNRGIVKVVTHSSTTVANVIVIDPVLSDNASNDAVETSMWAEGAWGLYRG